MPRSPEGDAAGSNNVSFSAAVCPPHYSPFGLFPPHYTASSHVPLPTTLPQPRVRPAATCHLPRELQYVGFIGSSLAAAATASALPFVCHECLVLSLNASFISRSFRAAIIVQCLTGSATVKNETRNLKTDQNCRSHHFAPPLYTTRSNLQKHNLSEPPSIYPHTLRAATLRKS